MQIRKNFQISLIVHILDGTQRMEPEKLGKGTFNNHSSQNT